jgi:ABC-type transporter Mla subunit MlaD
MAKKQEDINKEVKSLLKDLDEGYKKLGETNPFQSFKDFTEKGAKQLQDALRGVQDRVSSLGATIDDVVKKFKDLVENIQKIDMSVQKQINWFKKTNDLLGEAKQILKGNRDATADQLRSISDRLKYEFKSKGILDQQKDVLAKINAEVKEREKAEKK